MENEVVELVEEVKDNNMGETGIIVLGAVALGYGAYKLIRAYKERVEQKKMEDEMVDAVNAAFREALKNLK